MADLFSTGANFLKEQLIGNASQAIVYYRGSVNKALTAIIGRSVFAVETRAGFVENITSVDFIFSVSAWEALSLSDPIRGDKVYFGSCWYELTSYAGEPPWRYSDLHKKLMRVHTKQMES